MVERVTSKGKAANDDAPVAAGGTSRRADKATAAPKPGYDKKTIALVYDFDGTLSPQADAGIRLPAQDRHRPGGLLGREQPRSRRAARRPAHHLHAPDVQEGEGRKGVRIDRADLVAQGRDVELFPASRTGSTRSATTSRATRRATASRCATTSSRRG